MRYSLILFFVMAFASFALAESCESELGMLKLELRHELVQHYASGFCSSFENTFTSGSLEFDKALPDLNFDGGKELAQAHTDYLISLKSLADQGDIFKSYCNTKKYDENNLAAFDALLLRISYANENFRIMKGYMRTISHNYINEIEQLGGNLDAVSSHPLHSDYSYLKSYLASVPLNYFDTVDCKRPAQSSDYDFIDISDYLYCVVDFKTKKLTELMMLTASESESSNFKREMDLISEKNQSKIEKSISGEAEFALNIFSVVVGCAGGISGGPLAALSGCAEGAKTTKSITDTISSFLNGFFGAYDCDKYYGGMKNEGWELISKTEKDFDSLLSKIVPSSDFSDAYNSLSLYSSETILFRQIQQFERIEKDLTDFKLTYAAKYNEAKIELDILKNALSGNNTRTEQDALFELVSKRLEFSKETSTSKAVLNAAEKKYEKLKLKFDALGHCTEMSYGCYGKEIPLLESVISDVKSLTLSLDSVPASESADLILVCKARLNQLSDKMKEMMDNGLEIEGTLTQTLALTQLKSRRYAKLSNLKTDFDSAAKLVSTENVYFGIQECNKALDIYDAFQEDYSSPVSIDAELSDSLFEAKKCISELKDILDYAASYTDTSEATFYYDSLTDAISNQQILESQELISEANKLCKNVTSDLLLDVEKSSKYQSAKMFYDNLGVFLSLLENTPNSAIDSLVKQMKTTDLSILDNANDFYENDKLIQKIEDAGNSAITVVPTELTKYLEENTTIKVLAISNSAFNIALDILIENPNKIPYFENLTMEKNIPQISNITYCEIPEKPSNIQSLIGKDSIITISFSSIKSTPQHFIAVCSATPATLITDVIDPDLIPAFNSFQEQNENLGLLNQESDKFDASVTGLYGGALIGDANTISFSDAEMETLDALSEDVAKTAYTEFSKDVEPYLSFTEDPEIENLFEQLNTAMKNSIEDPLVMDYFAEHTYNPIVSEYRIQILRQKYENLKLSNSLIETFSRADALADKGEFNEAINVISNSSLKIKTTEITDEKEKIKKELQSLLETLKTEAKINLVSATKLYDSVTVELEIDYENIVSLAKTDYENGKYINVSLYSLFIETNLAKEIGKGVKTEAAIFDELLFIIPILGMCALLVFRINRKPATKANYFRKVFRNR
ncbi:MAG: hypothetical protein JXA43_03775 [Candidatus Diapherotrites archaeon]|nr:hypothetical protein [Candidatus Diapherotrites archaeon]